MNQPPANQILTIQPYRRGSVWVFDDEKVGLHAEPFVGEINTMINAMLVRKGLIPSEPFTALFSASAFPGVGMILRHLRGDMGGNWYNDTSTGLEGWLCPALFKYFVAAPKVIYVAAS